MKNGNRYNKEKKIDKEKAKRKQLIAIDDSRHNSLR